ncbi:hypothetical protein BFW01_g546 [Lasiodiplodia theobromae]|nr:hypothetical protein BFW01_g546 [Lasiodiplodia theobromae]
MPLFYTPDLCHLTRARGVEFPVNSALLSPPFSPNPHDSNSSAVPIATVAATTAPAQQLNNPSTPTHHGLPANTNPTNNNDNHDSSPLSIPVREASHVYHESYMHDIASRSDLELSALTGTFHWRGLDLLRRSIAFHTGLLNANDGAAAAVGDEAAERKKKRKMKHALESSKEKAILFVGGEGDLVGDRHGASVTVPPAQLLRLKALIVELTPDRVLGTIQWIEDHDVANVSIQLRPACLGANQQYCSNCTRLFYEVNRPGQYGTTELAVDPLGIFPCGHILCRCCVVGWLNDVTAKGRRGTQPCCIRFSQPYQYY